MHSIGEVVKQFEFYAEPLQEPIKGKVVKYPSRDGIPRYRWSISYHYRPTPGAGIYYPTRDTESSLKMAEMDFRTYAERFVPDQAVPNDHY